jgi:uncharacterized protein YecE (DUF72 family)
MPAERRSMSGAAAVPAGFQFAVKLNQKLTHVQRPRLRSSSSASWARSRPRLPGQLAHPVQLPPQFRRRPAARQKPARCRRSSGSPSRCATALARRETYAVLRQHGVALPSPTTSGGGGASVLTAGFVYARLRREAWAG